MKVIAHFSEECEVNVGVHQVSALSPLLFAIAVDIVTNEIKEGTLQKILYADDIVFIRERMAEQQEGGRIHPGGGCVAAVTSRT